MSRESEYIKSLNSMEQPSFEKIRNLAKDSISDLSKDAEQAIFESLERGVAQLESHEQLCCYLYAYGNMHQSKMQVVLDRFSHAAYTNKTLQIIDWGCGQGLATMCLLDYINEKGIETTISRIILAEMSPCALERAKVHLSQYVSHNIIVTLCGDISKVNPEDIVYDADVTIHLFSNILDIKSINLFGIYKTITDSIAGDNYFMCMSPTVDGMPVERIKEFASLFKGRVVLFNHAHPKNDRNFSGSYTIFRKLERKGLVYLVQSEIVRYRCKECGTINEVYLSDLSYDWTCEEAEERSMGVERMYVSEDYYDCVNEECQSPLGILMYAWEYPEGFLNFRDIEFDGATPISSVEFSNRIRIFNSDDDSYADEDYEEDYEDY